MGVSREPLRSGQAAMVIRTVGHRTGAMRRTRRCALRKKRENGRRGSRPSPFRGQFFGNRSREPPFRQARRWGLRRFDQAEMSVPILRRSRLTARRRGLVARTPPAGRRIPHEKRNQDIIVRPRETSLFSWLRRTALACRAGSTPECADHRSFNCCSKCAWGRWVIRIVMTVRIRIVPNHP
jgi:hypothetical protein